MLRKLAGSSFAAALIALMVMKHVVLGFCLCQHEFVLDRATCCAIDPAPRSCCSSENEAPSESPCQDCIIDLKINVDDFVWSADQFTPADQLVTLLPAPSTSLSFSEFPPLRACTQPTRGSPPGSPPIYLRQSVLRL